MFECEGQLDKTRLAAGRSCKAHTKRRRLRVEALGKRNAGSVWNEGKWNNHCGVAWLRSDSVSCSGGKEQGIQIVLFQCRVNSSRARQLQILRAVGLVALAISVHAHFIGNIEL